MDGRPLELTPREFAFLAYLARHAGKVCTHRMILETRLGTALWHREPLPPRLLLPPADASWATPTVISCAPFPAWDTSWSMTVPDPCLARPDGAVADDAARISGVCACRPKPGDVAVLSDTA